MILRSAARECAVAGAVGGPRPPTESFELPPTVSISAIAEMGALVGDPARANMLVALLDGPMLTARELADRAGVTPQTASGHLAKLKQAGVLRMDQVGRHRLHSLASDRVVTLLEALHLAGLGAAPERDCRPRAHDDDLCIARTCHDHLAGRLAVGLADALTGHGSNATSLSREGRSRLAMWGLETGSLEGSPDSCRSCQDWSEARPHIAGLLGAAILARSLSLGWLSRRAGHRALKVTAAGAIGYHQRFGILVERQVSLNEVACRARE